jgi:uncharacterized NAD(P)/FAD-binding protein YdhS
MKIAVVGAGISGANIVRTLLTHPNFTQNETIDIFEPRSELGSGLPYLSSDDDSIMLNVGPDKMSLDLAKPNDFVEWLEENYEQPENFEQLVSRPRYGKYLVERLAPYFDHEQVQHIQEEVVDLNVLEGQDHFHYEIKTTAGWKNSQYDAVFLAVGHPPYNNFYNLIGTENYIHNPYPMNETLTHFDNTQKIGIIGSGATGVDLMRFFNTHYELKQPLTYYDIKEPFNFVKIPYESGQVTFSFSMIWIEQQKEIYKGFIPLRVVLDLVESDLKKEAIDVMEVYAAYKEKSLDVLRKALETNDQELAAIQQYINRLIVFLPDLYNALNAEDRDDYLKNYHGILLFFKSLVPNGTYKWMFELIDAKKINAVADTINITPEDDGTFSIERKDGTVETADVLINASGFDSNLARVAEQSPLIKNLYNKKIILPHIDGRFILVSWPELHVINQRFGVMDNLFFTGLLIGGTQHENNDAPLTMRQAVATATAFMDQIPTL